jgi:hypothetical protein
MHTLILVRGGCAALMLTILTWFASVAIHHPDGIGIAIVVCLGAWGGVGWAEHVVVQRINRKTP